MTKIGISYDNRLLNHKISLDCRETPLRLRNIYLKLDSSEHGLDIKKIPPREIKTEELLSVHSPPFLDQIRNHCLKYDPFSYDKDTYLMEDSFFAAKLAAGGCLELADTIITDEVDRGFALVRPPGHHTTAGRAMGFCILNNIALTAQYLINKYKLERILILDFDAHHANGTQDIFYDTNNVLLISIHQNNIYPFSGDVEELGKNAGLGYTINIPVYHRFGDAEYSYLFSTIIHRIIEQYLPQIILVSAGYDAHVDDTISDLRLTTDCFVDITEDLMYFAKEYCNNRLLFILEGGYHIPSLENALFETLHTLSKSQPNKPAVSFSERADKFVFSKIYPVIKDKWKL